MRAKLLFGILAAAIASRAPPRTGFAASNEDPDWPCIQRKVPELSLGQIWNGPELPARRKRLVEGSGHRGAGRRNWPRGACQLPTRKRKSAILRPILPADDAAKDRMAMLVQGLFDHMNAERSQVISGIARYARKQLELAARLRKEASEVDALRANRTRTPTRSRCAPTG